MEVRPSWILAVALLMLWLACLVSEAFLGGLFHLFLVAAIGIALVNLLGSRPNA